MPQSPYHMPRRRLIARLRKTGWLAAGSTPDEQALETAVCRYQHFHGLRIDGRPGRVTQRSLGAPRFCGHPDQMSLGRDVCKWEKRDITWTMTGSLAPLANRDVQQAYQQAWNLWAAVCDIRPRYTSSAAADVRMGSGAIDAAGNTLAWSELPCGTDRPLQQKYDSSEPWVIAVNPPPHKFDLVRVAAHEIGHALGIPHIGPGNLLAPTYSETVRAPQPGDIAEAVNRYGRASQPEPEPTPEPTPKPAPDNYDDFLAVGLLGDRVTVIRNHQTATVKLQ